MAIIKAVSSRATIKRAIDYVTKEEKTEDKLLEGIGCKPDTAREEMEAVKQAWGKTDGRTYKHFVYSYPPEEKITLEQIRDNAKKLCEDTPAFKGCQILIAVHDDKENKHAHIIVNSVSAEDGHKLQWSKADLADMKRRCNELSREQGLSIPTKGDEITTYRKDKYKVLEKAVNGEYKSYVLDCYKAATAARETAISKEDFVEKMRAAGWETTWTDTRKHITFQDKDGNKVRASNLEKTFKEPFGKEDLQHGFESNLERANARKAIEQSRGLATDTRVDRPTGRSTGENQDAAIRKLSTAIDQSKAAVSHDESTRANRIANEQSRQRQRNGSEKSKDIKRSRSRGEHER